MVGDVDAEHLVLERELEVAVPFDAVGRRDVGREARDVAEQVEHRELPDRALLLAAHRGVDDVLGVVLVDEAHELHAGVAR